MNRPTTTTTANASTRTTVWQRLLWPEHGDVPPELARYFLTLGFSNEDQARMQVLAERNQEGELSPDEQEELHNYVDAGHVLALFQAKARKSLKQTGG